MLINENLIQLNADYKTKEEVITEIAKLFEKNDRLYDLDDYIQAVNDREKEVSTNMGDGIGIPHARTDAVKDPSLAFVRLRHPIVWDDQEEVKIVFQIAVPGSGGNLHLQILAKLARKLIYDEFKEKLLHIQSKKELLSLIEEATGGLI